MGGLRTDWWPDDELTGAPRLEAWGITLCDAELLWRVIGDPDDAARHVSGVADGGTLRTMQILAVDDGFTCARDRPEPSIKWASPVAEYSRIRADWRVSDVSTCGTD